MSDIRFEGWLHRSGTGGVYQDSAGNVGIASTQPQTRLDIGNGGFQVGPTGIATVTTVNTTNLINATQLSHRNIIINGDMRVAQRGTSATTSGMQTVDRFLCQFGGTDENPVQTQHTLTSSDTGPYEEGFIKSFHVQNGNQSSGAGAADFVEIYTALEDQDISTSGWNYKSSSSYITISFWVKSSVAQKFPGFLYTNQAAAGDSYMYSYQIDNGSGGNLTADTWTKITHSIPGNSSLSFNNDNTRGLSVAFFPFNGTDTSTSGHTDDAWAAWSTSNKIKDMTSTWYTTNNATFEITGVQLEVGSVATPFEHRAFGDELRLCQRYFQRVNGSLTGVGANSTSIRANYTPIVNFRASPSISGNNAVTFNDPGINSPTQSSFDCAIQFTYGPTNVGMTLGFGNFTNANQGYTYIQWDSATDYIDFDAEL